jgi:aminoglycoside phosphotransferase (APT) family kinase protein
MQKHDNNWLDYFKTTGYPNATPLAVGMEGAVYSLGNDKIAKVWASQSAANLKLLQRLYSEIATHELQFQTPEVFEIIEARGSFITIERELHGTPLRQDAASGDKKLAPDEQACILAVLHVLATVTATQAMKSLPVLGEKEPFWDGHDTWGDAIAALVDRRADQYADQLRTSVQGFDTKLSRITTSLRAIVDTPLTLIHGDLAAANILVDESVRPTAVLDFGFLTMAGDPAFDAAIAAVIFNMYGPHAQDIEDQLTRAVIERFDYPSERLTLYLLAYALITSNAYDPTGKDGHFEWCVNNLNRYT